MIRGALFSGLLSYCIVGSRDISLGVELTLVECLVVLFGMGITVDRTWIMGWRSIMGVGLRWAHRWHIAIILKATSLL